MKNHNKNKNYRVVNLIVVCFLIYFFTSLLFLFFDVKWETFQKINLVSSIFNSEQTNIAKSEEKQENTEPIKENSEQDFELYKKGEFITNFNKDINTCSLPKLAEKLKELKKTKKGKIRIAYFGDSMIEGDLLTQNFRRLLQEEFGGYGVGFLPIYSNVAGFRQTATTSSSGFIDSNFKNSSNNLYISGHVFTGCGNGSYKDNTIKNDSIKINKYLLFGKTNEASISYNGQNINISGNKLVNRLKLSDDFSHVFKLHSNTASLPLFGVSFESDNGIFVDNFSFRGISGRELNKISEEFLQDVQAVNHYDLIILQYGVNLLFRANDTDYSYYEKDFTPVLEKFKKVFSDSDLLLVSSADRAFRYSGELKTAIGLPNLIKLQAKMALDNGFAFYNQFESMGGAGTIINWTKQTPPLANKDYIHPNGKGGDILAERLFKALIRDYKKY